MPGAPTSAVAEWWRKVDQRVTEITDWHPSLPEVYETPKPSGLAGSGVNIFPARYASYENPDGRPPMLLSGVEVRLVTGGFHGNWRLRITATTDEGFLLFAADDKDFNIKLTPFRRWIGSAYFSSPGSFVPFTWLTYRADAYGEHPELEEFESFTGEIGGRWERRHTKIDWGLSNAVRALMGIRLAKAGDVIDIDAIMLEELLGDDVTPSAFADPPYIPTPHDPLIQDAITATQCGGQGNTYEAEVAVGEDYQFAGEQIPAIDAEKNEKRGIVIWNGTITLKKYNVGDGLQMKGHLEIIRNGEMWRDIEFTLPAIKVGHIPFTFSDFSKDEGELFYVIRVRNSGGSRFILQEVDYWWVELKL
jgi:hypothetical protein